MISRIFDMIEKAVNPPKTIYPDPQSISNNAYNQWGPSVNTFTGTGIYQYQQYIIAQQANPVQNNWNSYLNLGGTVTVQGSLSSLPNYPTTPIIIQPPTGMLCTIAFTDANGCVWSIIVDQAFATLMAAISQAHTNINQLSQGSVGIYKPIGLGSPAPQKMVDGDFSFDEMAEAELIIQELEGGQKSEGCTQA